MVTVEVGSIPSPSIAKLYGFSSLSLLVNVTVALSVPRTVGVYVIEKVVEPLGTMVNVGAGC